MQPSEAWNSNKQGFKDMSREGNQLDATEWFIALIICSTCFGHLYAHHQDLETVVVLLPHMVCNALVAASGMREAARAAPLIPDT